MVNHCFRRGARRQHRNAPENPSLHAASRCTLNLPAARGAHPMKKNTAIAKTVKEYLAAVPEPARSTLKKVRAAIRSAAPAEATEVISYGIPMFKYKGMLVGYAAF